jgi:hypothetical protein
MECEYLQLARQHEKIQKDPLGMPNREFPISGEFVKKNAHLFTVMQHAILVPALERNAVDSDAREALEALVQTYRTLGSGLYYQSVPSNPIAAAIFTGAQQRVAELRKIETDRGMHKLHDSQLLSVFILLQQLEYTVNNGRKKSRAFIENLIGTVSQVAEQFTEQPAPSSLIIS